MPTAEQPATARTAAQPTRPARADYGPIQVLERTGLAEWQWRAGRALGLIAAPDVKGRRWSAALADDVAARQAEIVAAVGTDPPVGGHRAAARLRERTGLDVEKWDLEALADAGQLAPVGEYKGWPLYDCRQLDAIALEQLAPLVDERRAWIAWSIPAVHAPRYAGLGRVEFELIAGKRGIVPGPLGRYARDELDALAADAELLPDRLLMTGQASEHLGIRPADFRHLVRAGLAVPHAHTSVDVTPRCSVTVALYRVGDLDALRHDPRIDWEALSAVRPGQPSPLRTL